MAESIPADATHAHEGPGHHAEQSFWSKYVFSTDHKMIAMQYMFTGMFDGADRGILRLRVPHAAGLSRHGCSRSTASVSAERVQRARHQPRRDHDLLGRHARVDRSLRELSASR